MRSRVLLVAASLFWPVSADAQTALETGNMFYADCSTSMGRTACISYVMGVTDALSLVGRGSADLRRQTREAHKTSRSNRRDGDGISGFHHG